MYQFTRSKTVLSMGTGNSERRLEHTPRPHKDEESVRLYTRRKDQRDQEVVCKGKESLVLSLYDHRG